MTACASIFSPCDCSLIRRIRGLARLHQRSHSSKRLNSRIIPEMTVYRVKICCPVLDPSAYKCVAFTTFKNLNCQYLKTRIYYRKLRMHSFSWKQDWLYHLGSPVQKENADTLVQKLLRNSWQGQQSVKAGVGPSKCRPGVTVQVVCPWSQHQLTIQRSWQQAHIPQTAVSGRSWVVTALLKWNLPSSATTASFSLYLLQWGQVLVHICHCTCPIDFFHHGFTEFIYTTCLGTVEIMSLCPLVQTAHMKSCLLIT